MDRSHKIAAAMLFLFSQTLIAESGSFRMRARENYEFINIDTKPGSWNSRSFSHTLNLWYEKPFQWAIGLAAGPYGMAYPETSSKVDRPEGIGQSIKMIHHGIEYKRWMLKGIFTRVGLYHSLVNSNGSAGKDVGFATLFGIGYEHNFDGIGLALEVDTRVSYLQDTKWKISSNMIALGVHFYEFFDKQLGD